MKFGSPIGASVAVINSPTVTLGSGSSVTVTSGNIAISNSPTVSVASGSINIANTPAVTVNSGTIAIGNTPTVKIASGTVTANLSAGSKVQITGPVALSAGTIVGVSSISNNVSVIPAGTFNVQGVTGGTAIGIAGSVTISSGSVNIGTITGAVSVVNQTNTLLQVSDAITALGQGSFVPTTGTVFALHFTLLTVAGCIMIRLTCPTHFYPHCVQAFNGTIGGGFNGFVTTAQFGPATGNRLVWEALIPCATLKTGKLTLEIYFTAPTTNTIHYSVFASTENPGVILRPDGRTLPIGVNMARGVSSSGNATIIPTKSTRRPYLKSLSYVAVVGSGNPTIKCSLNGTTGFLYTSPGAGRDEIYMEWEQGLLLDAGFPLTLTTWTSGTVAIATAVYDWTFQ